MRRIQEGRVDAETCGLIAFRDLSLNVVICGARIEDMYKIAYGGASWERGSSLGCFFALSTLHCLAV